MLRTIQLLCKDIFFVLLFAFIISAALLPYYWNGTIILGGEGDYVLDYATHLKKYSFMWFPTHGTGVPNLSPSGTGLNILFLRFIETLTKSVKITNFALVFSIYFIPFVTMYLLCKQLKASPFFSFLISYFYVVNPFVLYYLNCLNQWNVFSVSVMPLFLCLILRYYHQNFRLFFIFGFFSACFSFAYTNQPMLAMLQISLVISTIIVSLYYKRKFLLSEVLKKYFIVITAFILFNLWWFLPMIIVMLNFQSGTVTYSQAFAKSWLDTTVSGHSPVILNMFSLTTIINKVTTYDFFSFWYNTIFARIITLIPILLLVYFFFIDGNKKTRNAFNFALLLILLIVLFFAKGNAAPSGFIYNLMFTYVPLFNVFKTPVEKFGLLYVFIFSVLLLCMFDSIKGHRYYKLACVCFSFYLFFCSIPIFSGSIIPEYKIPNIGYCSRRYKDKEEYRQFRFLIKKEPFQYRILSMPGVGNYQVFMPNYNNAYYTGMDPVLMNTSKPFIATQNYLDLLYVNVRSKRYGKLLGIYNVGKVVINKGLTPWCGVIGIEDPLELEKIFTKSMPVKKMGSLVIFENVDNFNPKIYTTSRTTSKIEVEE
ncbi:MAG: hypothetical protein Q8N49_01235 [Candidatus Omnitrophota bacterium]|nr:hypothetical protein [Candidatus Omnitrophota bacterium]